MGLEKELEGNKEEREKVKKVELETKEKGKKGRTIVVFK